VSSRVHRDGQDVACIQIRCKSTGSLCWHGDISSRLRGQAFKLNLKVGQVFEGEAYIRAVPIIIGDVACTIWITCASVFTHIFTGTFDSEKIGKAGQFIPQALQKIGIDASHFRSSKKSLAAKSRATESAVAAEVWASSEQQFSFSIKGLVAWLLLLASSTGHWKVSDEEQDKAILLGKSVIDSSCPENVCFSVGGVVMMLDNGVVDSEEWHDSQSSLNGRYRLTWG
jgi:hypothetical protein